MRPDPLSPDAVHQEINVVPMNFRTDYIPIAGKPGEFKDVHGVDLVKKGSNGESTPWTIKSLQKEQLLWPYIKPFYERWLEGQEEPTEGTPLDVLPFLPKPVIEHLKSLLIRTAEDLAAANDADMDRIGMGARGWRQKTISYLEAKDGAAKISAVNDELTQQVERQQEEIEQLKAQVNSLVAVNPTVEPKKRGRPRKNPE